MFADFTSSTKAYDPEEHVSSSSAQKAEAVSQDLHSSIDLTDAKTDSNADVKGENRKSTSLSAKNSMKSTDRVIAVMGATGAGKSYFVRTATGDQSIVVGGGLKSGKFSNSPTSHGNSLTIRSDHVDPRC